MERSLDATNAGLAQRRADLELSWPAWTPRTFAQHLDHCAERWPDNIYIESTGQSWTYRDMAAYSRRAAGAFHRAGIGVGDRVALLMGNSAEFVAMYAGLTRIGAIAVPMNYLLGPEEMRYVLDHSAPSIVVLDCEIAGRDVATVVRSTGAFESDGPRLVVRSGLPRFEPWTAWDDLFSEDASAPDAESPTAPCAIMYTAGSSGTPKGALLHSDAMLREAYGTALTRGYDTGWSSLTALPSFHLFGLAQCILPATFAGGRVILRQRFDPKEQLETIAAGAASDIVVVAAMAHRLIDELATFDRTAHPGWALRSVFIGGDAMPEADWQKVRDAFGVDEVTSGFGMTELQGTAFMVPPGSSNEVLANTVGWESTAGCAGIAARDGAEHEWRLVDPDSGQMVAPGEIGELQYRGPSVSPGYWRVDPETDTSRADGWFRSGDLGRVREDGAFVFTGRNSDVYRSGGELVSPREVEALIASLPEVGATFVVGVPDRRWGQVGCAWIVPAPGAHPDPDTVIAHCQSRLARYKVPKYAFLIAEAAVPVSASGKFRRRGLVDLAAERLAEQTLSVPE
ncbi:fatty-acyl-CoA synthase [Acrocarpospora pleiomorpha]|uniref:Fatty-acyl-CoA synthase n=1 Tax=Acrocarpospora pleiomorpha TaxID=90975 RepID=A0A5M3X9F5_9ACTN|nr:class I adenylate-forming enzyme family protein [Acrocarpospora pleiomorpha]GES17286.1 fatty-acyl-CoA synthase [Acrocarpospora pleiomorpha]